MGVKLLGSKTSQSQFSVYTWHYLKITFLGSVHKNVKWHFFGSLLSLYVSVQTPNTNNQVLSAWFSNWRRSFQTLEMSESKWSQRWIPGRMVWSTGNAIFVIRAYPALSPVYSFWSVSAKFSSVWCSGCYSIPTSFGTCLCLKWLKWWNLNCLFWKRSSSEARRHHPLWLGENGSWSGPGDSTKLPCLIENQGTKQLVSHRSCKWQVFLLCFQKYRNKDMKAFWVA